MNYVSVNEINQELDEINQNIDTCEKILNDLKGKISEIKSANGNFKMTNGLKIANKKTIIPIAFGIKIFIDRVFINDSSVDVECTRIEEDIEGIQTRLSSMTFLSSQAGSAIEVIAFYLSRVQKMLDKQGSEENMSFGEKLQEARILMENDAAIGYGMLHSTPVLRYGDIQMKPGFDSAPEITYTGEYLQFFNEYGIEVVAPLGSFAYTGEYTAFSSLEEAEEYLNEFPERVDVCRQYYNRIMDNINNRYTDFHREALRQNLGRIIFEIDDSGAFNYVDALGNPIQRDSDAITYLAMPGDYQKTEINVGIGNLLWNKEDCDLFEYMVDAFTHETGHVLDNYLKRLEYQHAILNCQQDNTLSAYETTYSINSPTYMDFYNLLEGTDTINSGDKVGVGGLCNYAFADPRENFAELVAEYYGTGNGAYVHYSPDDLKAIQIQIHLNSGDRIMSAYEIMDNILNGRGFYG